MSLKTSPHQSQNLPWVKVHNLASQVLGLAARQVPKDCEQRYRFRPVLLETFVDPSRYRGTSYQAAGWQKVGQTLGRKKDQTQKEVSLKPLVPNARAVLRNRPDHSAPQQRRQAIRGAAKQVATHDDGQWRQRRRAINTLLIILFLFRLINATHRQGYEITRSQLWRQGQQQVPRYQSKPVSGAARCKAREKLDPKAFADRH
ncbi:MAG: DUF4338 domain-containing protein [Aestuariivita sp.]|nr:DUF4338 domain-containing protein [Aestuariivita sp.]MCY4348053.1 DUF4338 domain-containing protein [Aestuariivita sp.]